MAKNKILLLVEGAKTEPQLFKRIYELYGVDNIEIVSFCTNIYALYDDLKKEYSQSKDEEIPFDIIDIPLFLGKKLGENYQDLKFVEILLIFDFDPQDHRYCENKIKIMIENFNDAQGIGLLYLNYPMLESFKDFDSWEDSTFMTKRISYCANTISQYKKAVADTSIYKKQIKRMTNNECMTFITNHKNKLLSITVQENLHQTIYMDFCHIQLSEITSSNSFYILNTSIIHFEQEYGSLVKK